MKKGCLGCLGCGCLLVILFIVVPTIYGYYWATTEGRKLLVEGVQTVTEKGCKYAFEPETAAEIASLTKEIRDEVACGNIGIVESFNYVVQNVKDNEKLQGQVIFAFIYRFIKGKVTKPGEKPILVDEEGAEAVRQIMYALSQGKIDAKSATNTFAPILDKKNNTEIDTSNGQFKVKKVKQDITKEDMEKVVKALKEYVKINNLEKPSEEVTTDSLAKEEIIKFLKGLKNLKNKK